VPNTPRREGLLTVWLGRPDDCDDHDLVLRSVWRDLEGLRAFKGDARREARLLPEEVELSESAAVSHVLVETVAGPVRGMAGGTGEPWP
jgi:hypothetical protein